MMVASKNRVAHHLDRGVVAVIKGGILGILLGVAVFVVTSPQKQMETPNVRSP